MVHHGLFTEQGQDQMDHLGLVRKGGECPAGCLRAPCSSVALLHHLEVSGVEGARSWKASCVSGSVASVVGCHL
ncbi:hypothetical protein M404DRAFT_476653 [Pisolithus tinctorius Marx 270]|uniref:Uncharacterized protein n=1 Tax=Pisolithus tinctorius Marx 270 TaxID=870435 RepID=A0A0C3PYR8_PISTI|nr:hypothetical protein M404DRAFT_476653 [Pisolithus tinctorius Marx 270]